MRIGHVAGITGVARGTIRYYEKQGLIDPPARTESGYRNYSGEVIKQIRFIRRAQDLGFTLREIHELMSLKNDVSNTKCHEIKQYALDKVTMIEKKLADLESIRNRLLELIASCEDGNSLEVCPILDAFEVGSNSE